MAKCWVKICVLIESFVETNCLGAKATTLTDTDCTCLILSLGGTWYLIWYETPHLVLYSCGRWKNPQKAPQVTLFSLWIKLHIFLATSLTFNSLWLIDIIWQQKCGSTLAQVMACLLTAPNHYLNQVWLIIKCVQWHSPENIFTWITNKLKPYHHYKMWDEITYPFLNFNGATVEV